MSLALALAQGSAVVWEPPEKLKYIHGMIMCSKQASIPKLRMEEREREVVAAAQQSLCMKKRKRAKGALERENLETKKASMLDGSAKYK